MYDDDEFITDAKHTVDDRENAMSAEAAAAAAAAKEAAAKREEEKKLELEEARRNYKPSAGPVELAFGTIIVVYIVVFFIGMQRNKAKANTWLETFRPLLESQFAVLGDSSSTESKVTFLFTFFSSLPFPPFLLFFFFVFLFIIIFYRYLLFHFLLSPPSFHLFTSFPHRLSSVPSRHSVQHVCGVILAICSQRDWTQKLCGRKICSRRVDVFVLILYLSFDFPSFFSFPSFLLFFLSHFLSHSFRSFINLMVFHISFLHLHSLNIVKIYFHMFSAYFRDKKIL